MPCWGCQRLGRACPKGGHELHLIQGVNRERRSSHSPSSHPPFLRKQGLGSHPGSGLVSPTAPVLASVPCHRLVMQTTKGEGATAAVYPLPLLDSLIWVGIPRVGAQDEVVHCSLWPSTPTLGPRLPFPGLSGGAGSLLTG